jgi:hypothetical protein
VARMPASLAALSMSLPPVGLSAHTAQQQAVGRLYALLQSQAAVLSYVDAYGLLSMCSALMFLSSFLRKKNEPGKGGKVSVH